MLRSAVSRTALKATGQSGLGGSSSHAEGMHPNLGLHNAAASGNIGLVKFALENGQPANSNLNGILPLHAACSGGSEQSVRMLIFHGADVNAPRLKAKGSSGGPGAEGSTPLHFCRCQRSSRHCSHFARSRSATGCNRQRGSPP